MFLGPRDGLELPEQLSPVINFAVIPLFSRTRESVTSGYPLQASWYRRTFQPFGRSVGRVLDKPDGRIATAFFESAPVAPPSKTSFFRKAGHNRLSKTPRNQGDGELSALMSRDTFRLERKRLESEGTEDEP
jgi:hypothetical protein